MLSFTAAVRLPPRLVGGGVGHFHSGTFKPTTRLGCACSSSLWYAYVRESLVGGGGTFSPRYMYIRDSSGACTLSQCVRVLLGLVVHTFAAYFYVRDSFRGGLLTSPSQRYLCRDSLGDGSVPFHSGAHTSATHWGWVCALSRRYACVRHSLGVGLLIFKQYDYVRDSVGFGRPVHIHIVTFMMPATRWGWACAPISGTFTSATHWVSQITLTAVHLCPRLVWWRACPLSQRYVYIRDSLGVACSDSQPYIYACDSLGVGRCTFTAAHLHPRLDGGGFVHFHSGTFTSAPIHHHTQHGPIADACRTRMPTHGAPVADPYRIHR